jgi:acetoin utilization protein AcuC
VESSANAADEYIAIVYSPALASYDFGPEHPLQPSRYELTMLLLETLGWLDDPRLHFEEPRPASITELLTVHTYPYVQAVARAQDIARGEKAPMDLVLYGLGTEDDPLFETICDGPALYTGASIQAMQAVLGGRAIHAYNPAGGMHHAMKSRAAGFCVYNDCAAAIAAALAEGHRVAYVDLDAHHGDGVQAAFYEDPRVLTISVHESGQFLFPGTGEIDETGSGEGRGSCVNVPLPPFCGDEAILEAVARVVEPAVRAFAPALLVTQTGCDTHHNDPLTDLSATLALYPRLAERLHGLAHEVCEGRWLIVGGGGYDPADVTPRAWTAFFGTVLGHQTANVELPEEWLAASREAGGNPPRFLLDDTAPLHTPIAPGELANLLTRIEQTVLTRLLSGHQGN